MKSKPQLLKSSHNKEDLTPLESNHYSKRVTRVLKVVSLTLQSNGYSLQSVGNSPRVLNPPYTGKSGGYSSF